MGKNVSSRIVPGLLALLAVLNAPAIVSGQELSLHRDLPSEPQTPCAATTVFAADAPPQVLEQDRAEADRLAGEAAQAAILGDHVRARALLAEAARLDPTSASIAYRLGRVLEETGEPQAALVQFCRYLALEPEGADAEDVKERVDRLARPLESAVPEAARTAFTEGIARFDAREFEEAAREFSRALARFPDWGQAHFNRGLTYLRLGREDAGLADLERYLELRPEATDRPQVVARIDQLSSAPAPRVYSAPTTLLTGLLVPGMGHVYSGRPGQGVLVFLAAGASAAAGLLYTEVEIDCLTIPDEGGCPSDQILDRRETRPYLVHGLAGAAAITVVSALHAVLSVPRRPQGGSSELGVAFPLRGPESEGAAPVLTVDPITVRGRAGLAAALRFPVP